MLPDDPQLDVARELLSGRFFGGSQLTW
jgi:hypothetical protein